MKEITCPYCFEKFEDDKVHFRSEKILEMDNPLPPGYDSLEEFLTNQERLKYQKENEGIEDQNLKSDEEIKRTKENYKKWELVSLHTDDKYHEFWHKRYGMEDGNENNPTDKVYGGEFKSHLRPVIDPGKLDKNEYLLIRENDGKGIVERLKLLNYDSTTGLRVCPYCHNPLPAGYGKYPIKIIAVVGTTAAGKTVYLSQLLRGMGGYTAKVGMSVDENSPSIRNFTEVNPIRKDFKLPDSTEAKHLQQPLFYDINIGQSGGLVRRETLIMYDVGGECFTQAEQVDRFAPFIEHADAIILLIPPGQIEEMVKLGEEKLLKGNPETVLSTIKKQIFHCEDGRKNSLPVAVCISQGDKIIPHIDLPNEAKNAFYADYQGIKGNDGFNKREFNAAKYNIIGKALNDFLMDKQYRLAQYMRDNYDDYAWFVFTALGCNVITKKDDKGKEVSVPEGPIIPKHLEDPLLWLFYRFGYIGTNEKVFSPGQPAVKCPSCNSTNLELKSEVSKEIEQEGKKGFFGIGSKKATYYEYDTVCKDCGYKWLRDIIEIID